jgi:hypothetical protein
MFKRIYQAMALASLAAACGSNVRNEPAMTPANGSINDRSTPNSGYSSPSNSPSSGTDSDATGRPGSESSPGSDESGSGPNGNDSGSSGGH